MTIESVLDLGRSLSDATTVAAEWVARFDAALRDQASEELTYLFTEEATWHDFMSSSWDISNKVGREALIEGLRGLLSTAKPSDFRLSAEQAPVEADGALLVFFEFATEHRANRGLVRLEEYGEEWVCSILSTQAHDLSTSPAAVGANREQGRVHGYVESRERWADRRVREQAFADREPAVVILGAGHNGLTTAAFLKAFGVDTLVVERNKRVGDNWRERYSSLALHSLMNADHLAFSQFPQTWTEHTPKDKFAAHLENYVDTMDLNVWTDWEVVSTERDDAAQEWAITVRSSSSEERVLRPRHFIVAAGLNGTPKIPDVPGIENFRGVTSHSGSFQRGSEFAGKKAVVVGAGVSAHEIAQDLYEQGAEVTMLQRGGTYVINFKTFTDIWYAAFQPDSGMSTDYADMYFNAMPLQTTWELNKTLVNMAREIDRPLHDALEAQGFKLDWGPDGTGLIGNHLFLGRDSYQINCGASELIADGRIAVKQGAEIERATETGLVLTDGTSLDADVIVFATGYHAMLETIRPLLGSSGQKVKKVYGLADDGEYSECWRRSGEPGLYFATGFVATPRHYARYLALLIKAMELGLTPLAQEA